MSKRKPLRLGDIVKRLGGELIGDADVRIRQVATLESAGPTDITFLTQSRFLPQLGHTRAGAVILGPETRDASGLPRIISANPYAYFASVSALLNPPAPVEPGIHESAVVDISARVAASANIGACAFIGRHAEIADHAVVGPGCFIGEGASIGTGSRLHANVTVYHGCRIGARCIVHAGAVIGSDGFGIANEDGVWKKIPQIGRALIGDDVEIGANTTIDRGALDDTVIEDGVKLDNQIQIAHNCRIGEHTAIASCVGIAGSTVVGKRCMIGGAVGINGHIRIADDVVVLGRAMVTKSLTAPGVYGSGTPAQPVREWRKQVARIRRLAGLEERLGQVEKILKLDPKPGDASEPDDF